METEASKPSDLVLRWLSWADGDYFSARSLLLSKLLLQGAMLSLTAIEKYLKTVHLVKTLNFRWEHDVKKLFEKLVNNNIQLDLNNEYLVLLCRAYEMRYPDRLDVGFNLQLLESKLLIELDYSSCVIREFIKSQFEEFPVSTKLDYWLNTGNSLFLQDNCYYGSATRSHVFSRTSERYRVLVIDQNRVAEAYGREENVLDDGRFLTQVVREDIL